MRIDFPFIFGYLANRCQNSNAAYFMPGSIESLTPVFCIFFMMFSLSIPFQLRAEDQQIIKLGGHTIHVGTVAAVVEIAATPAARASGLMHRESIKANQGMLFIFPQAELLQFWMKKTLIPLDIGFFDQERFLIGYTTMAANKSVIHTSPGPAMYALEMNRGWFQANQVALGARLHLPQLFEAE